MQISRFDSVINVIVETYVGGHIPYTLQITLIIQKERYSTSYENVKRVRRVGIVLRPWQGFKDNVINPIFRIGRSYYISNHIVICCYCMRALGWFLQITGRPRVKRRFSWFNRLKHANVVSALNSVLGSLTMCYESMSRSAFRDIVTWIDHRHQ